GAISTPFLWFGCAGAITTLASAALFASRARISRDRSPLAARPILALAALAGSSVRCWARSVAKWPRGPAGMIDEKDRRWVRTSGRVILKSDGAALAASDAFLDALRSALVRHGLAVARSDGHAPWDLLIVLPPPIRLRLNLLAQDDGRIALAWRVTISPSTVLIWAVASAMVLL